MLNDITEDALLGGRIRIRQPARGYRVNVDTVLLAAAYPPEHARSAGRRVAELGCGVCGALLAIAASYEGDVQVEFVGIERDPMLAALARDNIALNGQAHRARIVEADALDPKADFGTFDHVLFNPPYDADSDGRPPSEARRSAYIAERPIEEWVKQWSNRMRAHAEMTLIHRAHRLREILEALEGRLGGVCVFPIRPCHDKPARRVIVRARKGSKAPLQLLKGLDLHPDDTSRDKYTPEAESILRGHARLALR